MGPLDTVVVAVGCVAVVAAFVVTIAGPGRHIVNLARVEERAEARRQRRVRRLVETGHLTRATERARHNHLDHACGYWYADLRPTRDDERNREFGGASTPLNERRCVVCRPCCDDAERTLSDHVDTLARTLADRQRDEPLPLGRDASFGAVSAPSVGTTRHRWSLRLNRGHTRTEPTTLTATAVADKEHS